MNNIVKQDQRAVKRVTRPMLGFKSFAAVQEPLAGMELMHMLKSACAYRLPELRVARSLRRKMPVEEELEIPLDYAIEPQQQEVAHHGGELRRLVGRRQSRGESRALESIDGEATRGGLGAGAVVATTRSRSATAGSWRRSRSCA